MSHQPSQAEVARQTAADYAASAAQTVSETLDPSRKQDEEPKKKPTMKQKLDQAAYESYGQPGQKEETYMEKAASYIPGASSLLGYDDPKHDQQQEAEEAIGVKHTSGPAINRPEHDVHVEEMLKANYRSQSGKDMPNTGEKSKGKKGQD